MKPPSEAHAVAEIADVIADLFDASPNKVRARRSAVKDYDVEIALPNHRFFVGYKAIASAGPLAVAVDRLKKYGDLHKDKGLPLIAVPFMGEVGRAICDRSGISWLDLSGNAKIVAPGIKIRIEGRPNIFSDRGRPASVFAPKSSRVARQLLLHPERFQTQAELAHQTGLGDGYISKIVRRLGQEEYLVVSDSGAVRPRNPDLLLDAWRDAYRFDSHRIIKGHVPARSGEELLKRLAKSFVKEGLTYAATGLCAAWLLTSFASFRLATVFVSTTPGRSLLDRIEFSDEPKGANVWLVVPNDAGVFEGSQIRGGVECASPVQVYLDLKDQPERAKDAAVELRQRLLNWSRNES